MVKKTLPAKKVTKCRNSPKENIVHHGQDSSQIQQNENNITKQLTEIRHNEHKNVLESKNLQNNKNQSNKEEHQGVHESPKETAAIIRDIMTSGIKEDLFSIKKHQVKERCCRGATAEDMYKLNAIGTTWVQKYQMGTKIRKTIFQRKTKTEKLFTKEFYIMSLHF